MPTCCVVGCKSSSSSNEPGITFHKLPSKLTMRIKWLTNIGRSNWSPVSDAHVCSMHFEEFCMNRTMHVARVKDDCIPTLFQHDAVIPHTHNVLNIDSTSKEHQLPLAQDSSAASLDKSIVLSSSKHNIQSNNTITTSGSPKVSRANVLKVRKLENTVKDQQMKIKRMHEKIRRQAKKIDNLKSIIIKLKEKKSIGNVASTLSEEEEESPPGHLVRVVKIYKVR